MVCSEYCRSSLAVPSKFARGTVQCTVKVRLRFTGGTVEVRLQFAGGSVKLLAMYGGGTVVVLYWCGAGTVLIRCGSLTFYCPLLYSCMMPSFTNIHVYTRRRLSTLATISKSFWPNRVLIS